MSIWSIQQFPKGYISITTSPLFFLTSVNNMSYKSVPEEKHCIPRDKFTTFHGQCLHIKLSNLPYYLWCKIFTFDRIHMAWKCILNVWVDICPVAKTLVEMVLEFLVEWSRATANGADAETVIESEIPTEFPKDHQKPEHILQALIKHRTVCWRKYIIISCTCFIETKIANIHQ